MHKSTKTYGHNLGLSCCFRQWRADHSHCSLLHGYSIAVKLVFESPELDSRNWVVDFGDLDWVKQYLKETFDHKTLVATDDPLFTLFESMHTRGLIHMVEVEKVGCEAFAEMIYRYVSNNLFSKCGLSKDSSVRLKSVEVMEHGANSAIYEE